MYQASQQTRAVTQVIRAHIAAWVETGADYYRAANLYEELSILSDAELRDRGFSRATLARDLCQVCDRTNARN